MGVCFACKSVISAVKIGIITGMKSVLLAFCNNYRKEFECKLSRATFFVSFCLFYYGIIELG